MRTDITPENLWDPGNVRWSFAHMREYMPSATVRRGRAVSPLPRATRDLGGLSFAHEGRERTLDGVIGDTCVDGLMVIHRGAVIYERYEGNLGPSTNHILQSVSKSFTSALAGVLVGEEVLDPADLVTDHIPELAGTCWDGCTIAHLLDMRAGVAFDESDYEDMDSESWRGFRALGWTPRLPTDPSPSEYMASLSNQSEHGQRYEYRSILTAVLGWCIERATGQMLSELFSDKIWQPLGAAYDADLLLGPGLFPLTDGGFCVTLQDLARFGLMFLREGEMDGRQVVPATWVRRLRVPDPDLIAAFQASADSAGSLSTAFYHDFWWVNDARAGVYSGYGIHGQQVLVHHPSETVVARMSSLPHPVDEEADALADRAMLALCESLA